MSNKTLNLTSSLYDYLLSISLREPPILKELRDETASLPNHEMQISPEQGQFMALLAELIGAKKTLDIGVYTGYSALAVALALPQDGCVIGCDIDEKWTQIARKFWQKAGMDQRIQLKIAPALQTLEKLIANGEEGSFDMAFIDADKTGYPQYYEKALVLVRKGGLVLIDNTLRDGAVIDPADHSESTEAIRKLNKTLHKDERVTLTLLPLADGLTIARKR